MKTSRARFLRLPPARRLPGNCVAWRDRPKATQFPGKRLAEEVTRAWRAKFSTPLPFVGGGEFAANNIAVYSADTRA